MDKAYADKVVALIDESFNQAEEEKARRYIGASVVGNDCNAYLQLSLRGFPNDPAMPRLKRIFKAGHEIEEWVVADMRQAGVQISEIDEETGKQFRREWLGGHVVCNADGRIDDPEQGEAIVEIKSMNDASHKKFVNYGVKVSHRHYYRQMQMLMAMFGIGQAFFIAYNKNTSAYHAQVVEFDQAEWDWLHTRIQFVLDGGANRIADDITDWRCKGCFKRSACYQLIEVKPECETCEHSTPNEDGTWNCRKLNSVCKEPCGDYKTFEVTPKG